MSADVTAGADDHTGDHTDDDIDAGYVDRERLPVRVERAVQARLGPFARWIALAGLALLVVGCILAWGTYSGFPGEMTLELWYAFPGGARLYVLLLGLFAGLAFLDLPGRRAAVIVGGVGAAAVAGQTIYSISDEGGGLVNVATGAWLAAVGGVVIAVAGVALRADRGTLRLPRIPAVAGIAVIVGLYALLLWLIVVGLKLEATSQFIAFVLAAIGIALGLSRVGVFDWLGAITQRFRAISVIAGLVAALWFPFTQNGDDYYLRVAASIGVFAAAAIGLNVVVGLAGLLDLGYVAFFGVGAYVAAILSGATLSAIHVHLPFLLVVPMGAVIAAIFGVIIGAPTLRLRGDYLAIVTLGFGEIFRITANNLDGSSGPNITNGPNGVGGIPDLRFGHFGFGADHTLFGTLLPGFANYYYVEIVLLIFVIGAFLRLNSSRIGRAWVAIREDEVAASAMGVNTTRLKLLAFGIGAFLAGAAGTVNAHVTAAVSPDSYTFLESSLLLAAVVLGGMGTVPGALLGSTLLILLPEKLRAFEDYRLLLFGLALVLIMRFRPEGIVASRRRKREFHEAEDDAALGRADEEPAVDGVAGGFAAADATGSSPSGPTEVSTS